MIWVEPCAGSLAVAMRLCGGRAFVGYMGGKQGYSEAILNAFGLKPGDGCDEIWCADTGGWRYFWEAMAKPGAAPEAADIIDGWERQYGHARPRDVRQCWDDRLAEWRADPTDTSPMGAARWLVLVHGSAMCAGPPNGPKIKADDEWRTHSRDGHAIVDAATRTLSGRLRLRLRLPPIRVWPDARAIPVPTDARHHRVLIDPPYDGTTGYEGGGLPRAEVRAIADAWRSAGARVGICEHERMAWPGWSALDITEQRKSGTSHRGRNRSEWLTLSEPAPVRPATQLSLWSPA